MLASLTTNLFYDNSVLQQDCNATNLLRNLQKCGGMGYGPTMNEVIGLTVYNPSALTDEDFLRGFVARQDVASKLIDQLKDVATGELLTHFFVVGQRGMGKTSMLRRLALAAKTDPSLAGTLIPLSFREEQYNVHSSQVFWTNCLDALGDWFDKIGEHGKAEQLDKEVNALGSAAGGALQLFNAWIAQENRRPMLLLDNIDLIFNGLKKEPGYLDIFVPRAGGIVIVGGSATTVDVICDADGELHCSFQITQLDRLSKVELIACLRSLALARGEEGEKVLTVLGSVSSSARVKTMHDLTGGNPRTLTMLYMLLETDTEGDVFRDLERLLDQATVLYKARVEDLPGQARVVLDAVALAWDPALAAAVAATTLLDVATVSSQLDRLQKEGIIEKVAVSRKTKTAFQISERFFNIWYLMRHGPRRQRSRLKWLTVFLKSFYSHAQLVERAKSLVTANGEIAIDVGVETGQYLLALSDAIDDEGWRSVLKNQARLEFERYAESLGRKLSEIVDPGDVPTPANAAEWIRHGNLLRQHLKRSKEAENAFLRALALEPSNWSAWFNLGSTRLAELANPVGAVQAFKKSLANNPRHLPTQYMLGDAYATSGENELAKAAFRACLKMKPGFYLAAIALADIASEEGNLVEALKQYQLAGKMAPERDTESLHASAFFAAYILEDFERAIAMYQRLVDLAADDYVALTNLVVLEAVMSPFKNIDPISDELLSKHSFGGQALIRSLEAIGRNDRTTALSYIPTIFSDDNEAIFDRYKGFILLLFRECHRKGWGDLLMRILDETGASDKNWPLRAAYEAFVYSKDRLLDINPEVRYAALKIHKLLAGPEVYRLEQEAERAPK
jgi:tetratricopeptide (TPR) repeat protein